MNELCQLVDEVGSIEISLDKAQAVGNEISLFRRRTTIVMLQEPEQEPVS